MIYICLAVTQEVRCMKDRYLCDSGTCLAFYKSDLNIILGGGRTCPCCDCVRDLQCRQLPPSMQYACLQAPFQCLAPAATPLFTLPW